MFLCNGCRNTVADPSDLEDGDESVQPSLDVQPACGTTQRQDPVLLKAIDSTTPAAAPDASDVPAVSTGTRAALVTKGLRQSDSERAGDVLHENSDTAQVGYPDTEDLAGIACPGSDQANLDAEALVKRSENLVSNWAEMDLTEEEKQTVKDSMLSVFLKSYAEQKRRLAEYDSKVVSKLNGEAPDDMCQPITSVGDLYDSEQASGLKIEGGHMPMKAPKNVNLPISYQEEFNDMVPLDVLAGFDCNNSDGRYLLSVYGYIYDVSSRPDKYGPDGPYSELTGKDITWGLFTGNDGVEYANRFYDIFKIGLKNKRRLERGLTGLCNWLAWYETEYGMPVGFLREYILEESLPEPPLDEFQDCVLM